MKVSLNPIGQVLYQHERKLQGRKISYGMTAFTSIIFRPASHLWRSVKNAGYVAPKAGVTCIVPASHLWRSVKHAGYVAPKAGVTCIGPASHLWRSVKNAGYVAPKEGVTCIGPASHLWRSVKNAGYVAPKAGVTCIGPASHLWRSVKNAGYVAPKAGVTCIVPASHLWRSVNNAGYVAPKTGVTCIVPASHLWRSVNNAGYVAPKTGVTCIVPASHLWRSVKNAGYVAPKTGVTCIVIVSSASVFIAGSHVDQRGIVCHVSALDRFPDGPATSGSRRNVHQHQPGAGVGPRNWQQLKMTNKMLHDSASMVRYSLQSDKSVPRAVSDCSYWVCSIYPQSCFYKYAIFSVTRMYDKTELVMQ